MNSQPIHVIIHGPLGDKYGAEHNLFIATPREAVRALSANYPSFRKDFLSYEGWAIISSGELYEGEDAADLPCVHDVHFCPRINGEAFLGAALIGFLIPAIAGTAVANIAGGLLVAGLLIGVSLLFTPKPKKLKKDDGDAKDESYSFAGPQNVTAQGVPVPLAYGLCWIGSVVISASLATTDIPAGV